MKINSITITRKDFTYRKQQPGEAELVGTIEVRGPSAYSSTETLTKIPMSDEQLVGIINIISQVTVANLEHVTKAFAAEAQAQLDGPAIEAPAIENQAS